ncbi:peptidase M50, partial [Magnetococcales bacterium HHB-1]
VQDPFNNQFFRIRPEAYRFVARLKRDQTVEEVWEACIKESPDDAPGQEEVIQLLSQLYFANLLYYSSSPETDKLFERYKKRKKKEVQSKLVSFMFLRIPLIDPDAFLNKIAPLIRMIFSPIGAIIWVLMALIAGKTVIDHFDQVVQQAEGVLAPENLFYLYLGLVIVKILHEFGHAALCKRFGGEVHTMGVMLILLSPLPYMDASASWGFRKPWKRAMVGAAGMIVEVLVASIAVLVWANTGQGVVHSLAYNMMFVASVSTVLFNANPLLRFDGYYILSDILDIPNLSKRSNMQLRHVVEKYLFGWRASQSAAETKKSAWILSSFGLLSGIYRIIIFGGILLFVADKYLLLGLFMAVSGLFFWLVMPLGRLIIYLFSSPRLERTRMRAWSVTLLFLGGLAVILAFVPVANR